MRYLKQAFSEFLDDDCMTLAAAIAYYTVFALPGLLVIVISVAGFFFSERTIEGAIEKQASTIIGGGAAQQIAIMVRNARQTSAGTIGTIIGIIVLLAGATSAFAQFQAALNKAWEVTPDEAHRGVGNIVRKRILSFLLILLIAVLLLVSVAFSATVSAAGGPLKDVLGGLSGWTMWAVNGAATFVIVTALFAVVYKVFPDADVAWRDVWAGAAITAALFVLGNLLLGWYLGRSNPGAAYGAAGSLVLILLWTYYASNIVLFGAEVSQVWANLRGRGIRPQEGAERSGGDRRDRPAA